MLAGCASTAPPLTSNPDLTARYAMAHIGARHGALTIAYPVIQSPHADALNRNIQQWIGSSCPLPDTDGGNDTGDVRTADTCLQEMATVCRDQEDPARSVNACLMRTNVSVATNAHNIIGLVLSGSIFMGGAHGTNYRVYRNIRLSSATEITAADLFKDPLSKDLQHAIEARLRQQYQLPPHAELSNAGFFDNHFKPTDNVLIQPDGLRFTYQNYEIGPYVLGQPTAFLPYASVASLMRHKLAIMETTASATRH